MTDSYNPEKLIPSTASRQGRALKPARKALLEKYLARLSLPAGDAIPDLNSLFETLSVSAPLTEFALEIGFGNGEHLLHRAQHQPHTGFIGGEMYMHGVGNCVSALQRMEKAQNTPITNIRLCTEDARLLMRNLPDASLDDIYLLFPDPWPKKRHWKRRIIQHDFLDEVSRLLKPNGRFNLASDHPDYREWALVQLAQRYDFQLLGDKVAQWMEPPKGHHQTRYERKGKAGFPMFFTFLHVNP